VALHPALLSATATIAALARHSEIPVRVAEIPTIGSLPYFIRMGLFRELGTEPPQSILEHEASGRFIPISHISSAEDLKKFIVEMVPLLHTGPDEVAPIQY